MSVNININNLTGKDLLDGFHCSFKLFSLLQSHSETTNRVLPLINGTRVHLNPWLSDTAAVHIKNGKIVQIFNIDYQDEKK